MGSKFFRVATEGDTTDGRAISAAQIQEMADSYNPSTYGARVWLEHMRGLYPDSAFRAYGDVTAVKAETVNGKLTLMAQIDPTPDLVALNKARQKIYSSVEIAPNFAKSGKAYLMGLGVTDSPASLGTDMLAFSSTAAVNPLAGRKLEADNLFTAAQEVTIELEAEAPTAPEGESFLTKIKNLLTGASQKASTDHAAFSADVQAAITAIAESQKEVIAGFASLRTEAQLMKALSDKIGTLQKDLASQAADFTALRTELDGTPTGGSSRDTATGAQTERGQTDC